MADTSVVMATYNGAKYVAEQIASLLRQTTPPAELVVADDQSSDDTVKIVTEALRSAPFRVRIERNAERKGYRRNFTEAASLCSAPLIAFCDQDDVWQPNKLARMERVFADPAVLLAYHNASITDERGQIVGRLYGPTGGRKRSESSLADPWSFSLGFTQVFRRELVAFKPLMLTYGKAALGKTAAWIRLLAARRRLAAQGLSYPLRHAARDLAFGVLLGRFAKISTVRPP